jgi:hypothetical protein
VVPKMRMETFNLLYCVQLVLKRNVIYIKDSVNS